MGKCEADSAHTVSRYENSKFIEDELVVYEDVGDVIQPQQQLSRSGNSEFEMKKCVAYGCVRDLTYPQQQLDGSAVYETVQ